MLKTRRQVIHEAGLFAVALALPRALQAATPTAINKTTTMPSDGQEHPIGQASGSPDANWITTWTQNSSTQAGCLVRTNPIRVGMTGPYRALFQVYHKQYAGKPLGKVRALQGGAVLAEMDFSSETIPNYIDGGYQRVTLTFNVANAEAPVVLELHYGNQHYIWTGAVNLSFAGSRRPFYNLAHCCENTTQVDNAIANGANGVEFDINPVGGSGADIQFGIYHPAPCPLQCLGGRTDAGGFDQYLSHLKSRIQAGSLAALVFDCKMAEGFSGAHFAKSLLKRVVKADLPASACIMCCPNSLDGKSNDLAGDFFAVFDAAGFSIRRDSYINTNNPYAGKTADGYLDDMEGLGLEFMSMGHDPFGRAPMYEWLPWIMNLTNRRDTVDVPQRKTRKVYFWTVDDKVTMRNCLDYGVDALISNYPATLAEVLKEAPYRDMFALADQSTTRSIHGFPIATPSPASPNLDLTGNWIGYYEDGSKSPYIWAIRQTGATLAFEDVGAGTNTRFTGQVEGNRIAALGKTATVSPDGRKMSWSDGIVWVKQ